MAVVVNGLTFLAHPPDVHARAIVARQLGGQTDTREQTDTRAPEPHQLSVRRTHSVFISQAHLNDDHVCLEEGVGRYQVLVLYHAASTVLYHAPW